jgi:hypothetical protein
MLRIYSVLILRRVKVEIINRDRPNQLIAIDPSHANPGVHHTIAFDISNKVLCKHHKE